MKRLATMLRWVTVSRPGKGARSAGWPLTMRWRTPSDARFIAQYCPVVEFGLPGQTMHKADENVAVADVENLSSLYAAFIRDYFG